MSLTSQKPHVLIIGAGLAGCEAAYSLVRVGIDVVLCEAKKLQRNPAQKSDGMAELVCSNSLKSEKETSAHGLLKCEMKKLGSIIISSAEEVRVPAGGALAVDRREFEANIERKLNNFDNLTIVDEIVVNPLITAKKYSCDYIIISSGPMTDGKLYNWIESEVLDNSSSDLYFYDAIAPVIDSQTLNFDRLYFKNRYEDASLGNPEAYLNVPLDKDQYEGFIDGLLKGAKADIANFENEKFFESCLPIDIMAKRGPETLRFSCMKPVGLRTADGAMPYAVIQLRHETTSGSAFNMVGFQNRLKYGAQKELFRTLPGFENADFFHLGSVHRNTYLNSAAVLNLDLSAKKLPNVYFAGQLVGVEGYTESAAVGIYVAKQLIRRINGLKSFELPAETALGSLIRYIMLPGKKAPSNINFGIIPSICFKKSKRELKLMNTTKKEYKRSLIVEKAITIFDAYLENLKL